MIRVLVVDDSAFSRLTITKQLHREADIEVVGQGKDGHEAVRLTTELKPDVITLDVTMPRMDGLEALKQIMTDTPTPVVMVSALTGPQTATTVEALELGAVDFYLKASTINATAGGDGEADLPSKIRAASKTRVRRARTRPAQTSAASGKPVTRFTSRRIGMRKLVVIGSSTGGPRALSEVVPRLPADLPAAVLIVQHMPKGFTKSMADRLDATSEISVSEAKEGDLVTSGHALVAPGDYHMEVALGGVIKLNKNPQVWGVRPAVDVTMESVVGHYGKNMVSAILTGMGQDGTRGAGLFRKAGGWVVAEDESTCAVYGMPKSVIDAGNADVVLPIEKIAEEITRACMAPVRRATAV
ncbi:MAG: chemotaxis response regulator protein-glutamate methylesterase [SAR202 cluster bacterium]|nr:chemotaxis response regulator protein-glutamate methylesterase [SAR202 cluster bacterium]MDP6713971.1 chemotaxis response regulator protein-glutamate methylesterase [SAR202 cluster bacterium]